VASTTTGGLSRVTIVAPRTRMDLALPTDVPLADLLPTLLRYVGEDLADEGAGKGGWVLSRLGGQILDSSYTPSQLDVRDGEVLYFTPRSDAVQELVFDDVVDATATATQQRAGRWTLATTRRFAVVFASVALAGGAVAVLFAGPPQLPGALAGFGLGVALVVTAAVLSRITGDQRASVLFGLVSLAYAATGGLLVLAGDRTVGHLAAPHILFAATALVVYAAVLSLVLAPATPVFLGVLASGVALGVGAAVCLVFGAAPAAAAAVIAAVVFALMPLLPTFAYRLARLPVPSVPAGPEDLKADVETVDGARILALADRADAYLTGLIGATATIALGAELVLALTGDVRAVLLCGVLALLLLLRARPFLGRYQRMPLLAAGSVGLGLVAVGAFLAAGPVVRLTAVVGGLVVAAVAALVYGLVVAGRTISPLWGRHLDIVEVVLIVAVIPLAAWVCGLYAWIRAIGD
jgi:type VII secretion integral membrane protein EccD